VTRVVLYGKPGCCLCDEARDAVERVRATHPFELEEVDVSTDAALHREYGERIPVLALDGEELFEFHVDATELARRLQSER
jgi:glutaredoxin